MFLDYPNEEAYQEGMSLEQFVEASASDEVKTLLSGKVPEMAVKGVTLDTAAFTRFQENMTACAQRVVAEKKAFEKVKKWLKDEYEAALAVERQKAELEAQKKRLRGKFLPELLYTLLFLGVWFVILQFITTASTNPFAVFKHVNSTWLIIWFVVISLFMLVWTIDRARRSKFMNAGRVIRFVLCIVLVALTTVSMTFIYKDVANNTHDISTAEELTAAGNFPKGSSFKLTADIDMEGKEIKYLFNEFYGEFWGNGYTISYLELKMSKETGLFRENYGTIDSVKVKDLTINWTTGGSYYQPKFKLAALVTENYGTVKGSCSLENVKYDYYNDSNNQKFDTSFTPDFDVCRGHFVAFNAGTVDSEHFTTYIISSKDNWLTIWSSYVGHTDMAYAVTPNE